MPVLDLSYKIALLRGDLFAFTKRFTSDKEESLDLVQDTILKALMYQEKYREDTNLKGWLFTIMRNTFINQYRKIQRSKTYRDSTKESYFLNIKDDHTFNSPDSNFEYKDVWLKVNGIAEQLLIPFKMHASGYKYNEIADHLNIPIGTVKNRIFQARKEIQKRLQGY
jgi:RNA polymerase sigma factor (sigma-70 family)